MSTLSNLDNLLGVEAAGASSSMAEPKAWWQVLPSQSRAPRQHLMAPGNHGRFINEEVFKTEVRQGRPTPPGAPLDVPYAQPLAAYLILAAQVVVYALGTSLAISKGAPAADDFFMALAMDPASVLANGEWWRLGSSTLLHAGMLHLTLNCWALSFVGVEAEAVLGTGIFTFTYLMSGAAGSAAALAVGSGNATIASSAAVFGLLGALMGTKLRNRIILPSRPQAQVWAFLGIALANMLLAAAPEGGEMGGEMVSNAGHLSGFLMGLLVCLQMGPRFQLLREVEIPDGSMTVPDDARELTLVVDQRGTLQRMASAGVLVAGLAASAVAAAGSASAVLGAAGASTGL